MEGAESSGGEEEEEEQEIVEEKYSVPLKKTTRLTQIDHNEVIKAIEASKKPFFENTNCIYCGFNGSNSRSLAIHVARLHKYVFFFIFFIRTFFLTWTTSFLSKLWVGVHSMV